MPLHQIRPQARAVTAQDASLTRDPFRIDPAGGLVPIEPGAPPCVTFRWREQVIHAALVPDDPPDTRPAATPITATGLVGAVTCSLLTLAR
jgi:hypothetical protein